MVTIFDEEIRSVLGAVLWGQFTRGRPSWMKSNGSWISGANCGARDGRGRRKN